MKMKMNALSTWIRRLGILAAVAALLPACGNHSNGGNPGTSYTQIERLARPAINEGLVVSNDHLNAFNSIPPSQDLSPAAQPVINDAATTLAALGNSPARVGDLANAFLPDVMRIDTTIASAVGTEAYPNDAVAIGASPGVVRPVAGRKIEDSVMHVTLSVLTNGGITTDNVSYPGQGTPQQPGHKLLFGQAARNATASFPFVAAPN
jgi:hypothetical protein